VADHPLRPATDRSLGRPLPYQLANQTQAHLQTDYSFHLAAYAVLAGLSAGYPPSEGRFLRVTHPSATGYCYPVRLACVRHTASVRPEPGSNSPLPKSFDLLQLGQALPSQKTMYVQFAYSKVLTGAVHGYSVIRVHSATWAARFPTGLRT
jgi:hypothetical protein